MTPIPPVILYYATRAGRRHGELVYNVVQEIRTNPPTYRAQLWVGPDGLPTTGRDFATAGEAINACRLAGAWELRAQHFAATRLGGAAGRV